MKTLIITLLLIIPGLAYSNSLYVGLYTAHFESNPNWNNNNNLIAVEFDNYLLATFKNSHGFQTYLAGREKKLNNHISAIYGVTYGYDPKCLKIVPGDCYVGTYAPSFLPALALKFSYDFGPANATAIVADYISLSIGIDF
jgi:hypothetical protein